jgi:hypothetical protein
MSVAIYFPLNVEDGSQNFQNWWHCISIMKIVFNHEWKESVCVANHPSSSSTQFLDHQCSHRSSHNLDLLYPRITSMASEASSLSTFATPLLIFELNELLRVSKPSSWHRRLHPYTGLLPIIYPAATQLVYKFTPHTYHCRRRTLDHKNECSYGRAVKDYLSQNWRIITLFNI